eukprot:609501-Rhodomonas_salina.1
MLGLPNAPKCSSMLPECMSQEQASEAEAIRAADALTQTGNPAPSLHLCQPAPSFAHPLKSSSRTLDVRDVSTLRRQVPGPGMGSAGQTVLLEVAPPSSTPPRHGRRSKEYPSQRCG